MKCLTTYVFEVLKDFVLVLIIVIGYCGSKIYDNFKIPFIIDVINNLPINAMKHFAKSGQI